jgi:hypothetical protein
MTRSKRTKCEREGCIGKCRSPHRFCTPICLRLSAEMDRAVDVLPQAEALGVTNTSEQWTALVEASDAWTRYLYARRAMGWQIEGDPPWSKQEETGRATC